MSDLSSSLLQIPFGSKREMSPNRARHHFRAICGSFCHCRVTLRVPDIPLQLKRLSGSFCTRRTLTSSEVALIF